MTMLINARSILESVRMKPSTETSFLLSLGGAISKAWRYKERKVAVHPRSPSQKRTSSVSQILRSPLKNKIVQGTWPRCVPVGRNLTRKLSRRWVKLKMHMCSQEQANLRPHLEAKSAYNDGRSSRIDVPFRESSLHVPG